MLTPVRYLVSLALCAAAAAMLAPILQSLQANALQQVMNALETLR